MPMTKYTGPWCVNLGAYYSINRGGLSVGLFPPPPLFLKTCSGGICLTYKSDKGSGRRLSDFFLFAYILCILIAILLLVDDARYPVVMRWLAGENLGHRTVENFKSRVKKIVKVDETQSCM